MTAQSPSPDQSPEAQHHAVPHRVPDPQRGGEEWPFWLVALVVGVTTFAAGVVIGVLIRGPAWRRAAAPPLQSNLPPDLQALVSALAAYHGQYGTLPSRVGFPEAVFRGQDTGPDRREGPWTAGGISRDEQDAGEPPHPIPGTGATRPKEPPSRPAGRGADLSLTAALIGAGADEAGPRAVTLRIANAGPDRADDVVVEIRAGEAVERLFLGVIEAGDARQVITAVEPASSAVVTFSVHSSAPDPAQDDNEARLRLPRASSDG